MLNPAELVITPAASPPARLCLTNDLLCKFVFISCRLCWEMWKLHYVDKFYVVVDSDGKICIHRCISIDNLIFPLEVKNSFSGIFPPLLSLFIHVNSEYLHFGLMDETF